MLTAGLDIGNQTTEVALARVSTSGQPHVVASSLVLTTGIKGSIASLDGAVSALRIAVERAGVSIPHLTEVRINEAAPVVAGVAMQALAETILTDSTIIGHDPDTPGGRGLGVGRTVELDALGACPDEPVVAVVPGRIAFDEAARQIAAARDRGARITAAIVQADDGVLIANRLAAGLELPIVDEVANIDAVPLGELAAVEVAPPGATIQSLCNPFGLATIFALDADETRRIAPAARALAGLRSAVAIRTPAARVAVRTIPPGGLTVRGARGAAAVSLADGAAAVMAARERLGDLHDVAGEPGTMTGAMFAGLKSHLATAIPAADAIAVADLLAVDLLMPQPVRGGLSHEVVAGRAVALAALVQAGAAAAGLARELESRIGRPVVAGGRESEAGIRGALTTPGAAPPLLVLDLGSGSTNAARIDERGGVTGVHLAGGGSLVDLLIGEELGIADAGWREDLKRCRAAFVESLFSLRHEDRSLQFLPEPVHPSLLGQSVIRRGGSWAAVPGNPSVERIVEVRQHAKTRVFGRNADHALARLAPGGNRRVAGFLGLIGGSALDFELPALLAKRFAADDIVVGSANVLGTMGPRNAVAAGLALGGFPGQTRR